MVVEKICLKDVFPILGENNANPTVECYLPYNMTEMNRQDKKRPCMVVCPGGGYEFCSQREAEPIALNLLPMGFNVFVLTYSTFKEAYYPTQLLEVAATFELIKQNADKWNCDIERIGIMGFSAGGHLAAHYSNSFDCPDIRDKFKESIRPFASVLCYPVISSDAEIAHRGSFENLLGYFPDADNTKYSCDKLVNENTPQAFIWHTAEDTCVPVENSLLYALALKKQKIPFELHIYPHGWHGLSTADAQTCDNIGGTHRYVNNWLTSLKKWVEITF